jgi:RND family efflux transporter MFP subunit
MGCRNQPAPTANAAAVPVTVSEPLNREVTDYAEYTGQTAAVDMVQIRARVNGFLDKINFKDGAEVQEGSVLYEIDPRPYQDQLSLNEAQLAANQAALKLAQLNFERAQELWKKNSISAQEYDQNRATRDQASATVKSSEASVAQARLNLQWTKIQAPISGQLGRTLLTRGNLITAGSTVLTTITSLDPMYAYFNADERTVLHVRQLIREGKFQTQEGTTHWPVFLGLLNETGFPHDGFVDFSNNLFSSNTATLEVRGVFANPKPKVGDRLLAPGLFVNIRVPVSPPHSALLISQDAVAATQDVSYVYIVNAENRVEVRDVTLGGIHDGLQSITKGLQPNDRVIINGLQYVKPGTVVALKLVPMPIPRPGEHSQAPPTVTPLPKPPGQKK